MTQFGEKSTVVDSTSTGGYSIPVSIKSDNLYSLKETRLRLDITVEDVAGNVLTQTIESEPTVHERWGVIGEEADTYISYRYIQATANDGSTLYGYYTDTVPCLGFIVNDAEYTGTGVRNGFGIIVSGETKPKLDRYIQTSAEFTSTRNASSKTSVSDGAAKFTWNGLPFYGLLITETGEDKEFYNSQYFRNMIKFNVPTGVSFTDKEALWKEALSKYFEI